MPFYPAESKETALEQIGAVVMWSACILDVDLPGGN